MHPNEGATDTFLSIGQFNTMYEAEAACKYIKTKFLRLLVGAVKATQHNPKATWIHVPFQDFTESSDIDWLQPIPDIDQQLYRKYELNDAEIDFIETHIKEML